MGIKCILCNKKTNEKHGHNPDPVSMTGRCCTECNESKVIPARLFGPNKRPRERFLGMVMPPEAFEFTRIWNKSNLSEAEKISRMGKVKKSSEAEKNLRYLEEHLGLC
jgi:hypothetical protein